MPWRHVWEWRYSSTFLELGTRWRWVISFTPQQLYSWGKSHRYPFYRRLGGSQNRCGCRRDEGNMHWRESKPDRPACSPSLYRLSYLHSLILTLIRAFCFWSGNGYITTQTLREILAALDDKLGPEDLDGIIAEIDTDGSGTVDFDGKWRGNYSFCTLAPWSCPSEANCARLLTKFPVSYGNLKVKYRIHKSLSFDTILSQMHPVKLFPSFTLQSRLGTILPYA
jgi:hypothetical protein